MTSDSPDQPHPEQEDLSVLSAFAAGSASGRTADARPTPFDKYTLLRSIGRGGFGEVFVGVNPSTWDRVAVKVLSQRRRSDSEAVRRFELEIQIGKQLKHPHILPIVDDGEWTGIRYFVTPFVDGQDLLHLIEKRPLPIPDAVALLVDIAGAVSVAHAHGYLHRDLKPANILIESTTGKAFVADFGLAKGTQGAAPNTETLAVLGTQPYMPPEQADPNLGEVSPATDIYAIGATLYQVLTGRTPFPRPDRPGRDIVTQIAWDRPLPPSKINPEVPADLDRVCLVCLQKSPFDRYQTAEELAADLRRVQEGKPVEATMPGRAKLFWRHCQRRPAQVALTLTLLLAAIGGAIAASHYSAKAGKTEVKLAEEQSRADQAETTADFATRRKALQAYAADLREVAHASEAHDVRRMQALLDRTRPADGGEDLRGLEWYYWDRLLRDMCRRIEGEPGVRGMAMTDDDRLLVTADATHACLWDLDSGTRRFRLPIGPDRSRPGEQVESCQAAAFSPDGSLFAATCFVSSGQSRTSFVRVWETASGVERFSVEDGSVSGQAVVFSPDGTRIIAGGNDGQWRAWDAASGLPAGSSAPPDRDETYPRVRSHPVLSLRFTDDAAVLETVDFDVHRWDWKQGRDGSACEIITTRWTQPVGTILGVRVNGDSLEVLSPPEPGVPGDSVKRRPLDSQHAVTCFDILGQRIVAGCADRIVRVWTLHPDARKPAVRPRELRGCPAAVTAVALGQHRTVAAAVDGTICVWDAGGRGQPLVSGEGIVRETEYGATRSPSGRLRTRFDAATGGVTLTDAAGATLAEFAGKASIPGPILYSLRDGFVAFHAGAGASIVLWDVRAARQVATVPCPLNASQMAWCFSPDERRFAVALGAEGVHVVETATGASMPALQVPGTLALRFSADGARLGIGTRASLAVWDFGKNDWVLRADRGAIDMAFEPGGSRLFVRPFDDQRALLVGDTTTGEIGQVVAGAALTGILALSTDGRRLYAVEEGRLQVFIPDPDDLQPVLTTACLGMPTDADQLAQALDALVDSWKR